MRMLLYEEVMKIAFRKDYRVAGWQIWKSLFFCILMLMDVPPFKKCMLAISQAE